MGGITRLLPTPTIGVPTIALPTIPIGTIHVEPIVVPTVAVPTIPFPELDFPALVASLELPRLDLPEIELPTITVRTGQTPDGHDAVAYTLEADVLFDYDQHDLRPDALAALAEVRDSIVARFPDGEIMIQGHTDSHGTNDYNFWLSDQRSATVQAWLIATASVPSGCAPKDSVNWCRLPLTSTPTAWTTPKVDSSTAGSRSS